MTNAADDVRTWALVLRQSPYTIIVINEMVGWSLLLPVGR